MLTDNPGAVPYSIVVRKTQDGVDHNTPDYHETYTYVDGLGRTIVSLSEADPNAGDTGQYVVQGFTEYDAKGARQRAYLSWFWSGDPLGYSPNYRPPTYSASTQYDAFGRQQYRYGLDGRLDLYAAFHALSTDRWDAEDIASGPHEGTYATVEADGHGRMVRATERVHAEGQVEERHLLAEYLPTGEPLRITQRRIGSPDVVRWFRYDSLGRLVLNAEPNTSTGLTSDFNQNPSSIKAWRYAYNDLGQLVGVSDARGCGVNIFFDRASRPVAEDYSPCLAHHPAYTAPNLATGDGTEAFYRYDLPDPDTMGGPITDAAGNTLVVDGSLLWGQSVSLTDSGSKGIIAYDALGRSIGGAFKVVKPGTPAASLDERFAPRWYVKQTRFDGADRVVEVASGATSPELLGSDNESVARLEYTRRGIAHRVTSSYGTLLAGLIVDENGLPRTSTFGDGAATERAYAYDDQQRMKSAQTYRAIAEVWSEPQLGTPADGEPTQQLLLEDCDFEYDAADNVTRTRDWRIPDEWPGGAQPVTRAFEYDDLYQITRSTYEYPSGTDAWTSPFEAENTGESEGPKPGPHVSFSSRVLEQRYAYDHLQNTTVTRDDAEGFYDRSLGTIANGTPLSGPHQLVSASNRATNSPRAGDLDVAHDDAGNLTDLIVRRDGPCLPTGASCWQRFHYEWDQVGHLSRALRWDLRASNPDERSQYGDLGTALPPRTPDVELRYSYDGIGRRVLKTAIDANAVEQHTVYIFDSLELRGAAFEGAVGDEDYTLTSQTETVYLPAGGPRARVLYSEEDLPSPTGGNQHVFLIFADHLGSGSFIVDHQTGELVEYSTYQAYGQVDSDYRPGRWGASREPYKFSGKEEDVEVGLAYFGSRYLSLGLNRWASADPVSIHQLGSGVNPYSYVNAQPLVAVDPNGREIITAIVIGVVIGAIIAGSINAGIQWHQTGDFNSIDWGLRGVAGAAIVGGVAGGLSGGVGAFVGGLFSSAVMGAIIGGAAGGAAGAAGAYATTWAMSAANGEASDWSACGNTAFSACELGTSMLIGAGVGAAAGYVSYQLSGPPSAPPGEPNTKVADAPDIQFDSPEEAAEWASSRYYDSTRQQGVEYGGYIHKLENGKYVLGDIYVGDEGSVTPGLSREVYAGDEVHVWHTHPTGPEAEMFSEGQMMPGYQNDPNPHALEEGDFAATQARAQYFENDAGRTYMMAPSRTLRSIGVNGPMNYGVSHGTVGITRTAPVVGGAVGGSVATPVVRAQFAEWREGAGS